MTTRNEHDHDAGAHRACAHHSAAAVEHDVAAGTIWTCPMHPQIRWDHPGNCPICGMALEPLEPTAEEGPNPALIDMSRRFWGGPALPLPRIALTFGAELLGWEPLPMRQSLWLQLALATP